MLTFDNNSNHDQKSQTERTFRILINKTGKESKTKTLHFCHNFQYKTIFLSVFTSQSKRQQNVGRITSLSEVILLSMMMPAFVPGCSSCSSLLIDVQELDATGRGPPTYGNEPKSSDSRSNFFTSGSERRLSSDIART